MWSQALGVVVTPHVSLHPNLEEGLLARHHSYLTIELRHCGWESRVADRVGSCVKLLVGGATE